MNESASHVAIALDGLAHDLRNHLSVLAMGASLVSDEDGRDDLIDAVKSLQRNLERLITSARAELPSRPEQSAITLGDILTQGLRRAAREGRAQTAEPLQHAVAAECEKLNSPTVHGTPLWLERLVADLWHLTPINQAPQISIDADHVELRSHDVSDQTIDGEAALLVSMMNAVAQTSGGSTQLIDQNPATVIVRIKLAASV